MAAVKYTIGKHTFCFSLKIVKKYDKKENFFSDILKAYPNVNKKELEKVLERVWKEAFPAAEIM